LKEVFCHFDVSAEDVSQVGQVLLQAESVTFYTDGTMRGSWWGECLPDSLWKVEGNKLHLNHMDPHRSICGTWSTIDDSPAHYFFQFEDEIVARVALEKILSE
jgi:hypothetical protein